MGKAVTAQAMPTPSMNCVALPRSPSQAPAGSSSAAPQPSANGKAIASRAVVPASRFSRQAARQVQLHPGDEDEQHHAPPATPLSSVTTCGLKTKS
jgi:hypothetical protein